MTDQLYLTDIAEELDNELRALEAFSSLCTGCKEQDGVDIPNLTYLLDPILERQRELIDILHKFSFQVKDINLNISIHN